MAGATHISELVEQLRSEAEFDSMGEFTLALEQAITKIRHEAQQTPARYLLYSVQAAVALRALSVRLSLSHQIASLEIVLERDWECFADSQALMSMQSGQHQGLDDFRQALLWGRALQPSQVDVIFRGPQGGYLLTLQGDDSLLAVQPAKTDGPPYLQLLLTFTEKSVSRVAEFSHGCAARLQFCPVPVFLDGLLLNGGNFQGQERGHFCRYLLSSQQDRSSLAAAAPLGLPALTYALGPSTFFERGRIGEPFPVLERLELLSPQDHPLHFEHFEHGDPPALQGLLVAKWEHERKSHCLQVTPPAVSLPASIAGLVACRAYFFRAFEGDNKLYIVQRGCTLSSLSLPGLPVDGWRVAVSANQVKTDLSGLAPVDNEDTNRLIQWTCDQILAIHAQMAKNSR